MTGDPGWKRNAWPIRLSPNTSTQLSRDSSCSWTRKKKIHAGKRRFPYFPFFLLLPSPELLRSLRKEYASCDISDMISRKKKRRDDSIVETWRENDFSKTKNSKQPWPNLRAWKKNRESNNFSAGSIKFREYEFRSDDKNCMERPRSSLFFVQTDSKGRRRGRREKRKKKKKKEKRKNEEEEEKEEGNEKRKGKKRQSIFERITVNTIFSRVLRHGTELLLDFYFYIRLWTFNKAVFTRRERCEDPGWGEGRGEG